jgi:hypothetical protein
LSNDTFQATIASEKEERKYQIFTELSAHLSQITPTAAISVTPALSKVTVNTSELKDRVERNCQALGGLWEDLFNLFLEGVTKAMSARLEVAFAALESSPRETAVSAFAEAATLLKRKLNETSRSDNVSQEPFVNNVASGDPGQSTPARAVAQGEDCREFKRRRMSGAPSKEDSVRKPTDSVALETQQFLQELKDKLEVQAHSLDILNQENSQVKDKKSTLGLDRTLTLISWPAQVHASASIPDYFTCAVPNLVLQQCIPRFLCLRIFRHSHSRLRVGSTNGARPIQSFFTILGNEAKPSQAGRTICKAKPSHSTPHQASPILTRKQPRSSKERRFDHHALTSHFDRNIEHKHPRSIYPTKTAECNLELVINTRYPRITTKRIPARLGEESTTYQPSLQVEHGLLQIAGNTVVPECLGLLPDGSLV